MKSFPYGLSHSNSHEGQIHKDGVEEYSSEKVASIIIIIIIIIYIYIYITNNINNI